LNRLSATQLGLRFSALELSRFGMTDLSRYNVLVFPAIWGSAETYRALLGESGIERLRRWIEAGGTAIGIETGAAFLADAKTNLARTRPRAQALDTFPPLVWGPPAEMALEAGLFQATGLRAAPKKKAETETPPAKKPAPLRRESPYDVAPVLGPGAQPFAQGVALGTPAEPEKVPLAEWIKPFLGTESDKPDARELEKADERLRRFSPRGAFLRLDLDPQVWLNWGLPEQLDALVFADDTFVAAPPVAVAARFPDVDRLHLGGLLWPEAAARFARTTYLTREEVGRGQVVLFLDDPVFREWTLGTRRLLVNALLYGPGLGTQWPAPW
jgi:hypothetical protein